MPATVRRCPRPGNESEVFHGLCQSGHIEPASTTPELYCSDFNRSLRFYTDVLGFAVVYERQEDRFAFLDRSGAHLMIEQTRDPGRRLLSAELCHPFGRGVNLQIDVENVDVLHDAVIAAGVPIFRSIEVREYRRARDWVTVRQFVVSDPDGYLLRLSQTLSSRSE